MAITKRRNKDGTTSYQVRVHLSGQGKVYAGSYPSLKEARAREVEAKRLFARLTPGGTMALNDWADVWLEEQTVSKHTLTGYHAALDRVRPHLGDSPLQGVTRDDLQAVVTALARSGKYTRDTIRQTMTVTTNCIRAASLKGWFPMPDTRRLRYPTERKEPVRPLTKKQASALIAASGELELFVRLGLASGCRLSELLGTDREAITGGVLDVRQQFNRGELGPLKSDAAYRQIHLPPDVAKAIKHLPDGPLFRSKHGERLSERSVYRLWNDALTAAGLSGFTPHDLRHTYASVLIGNGVDIKTVQRMMGHASAQLTLDRYAHLMPDAAGRAAAVIGEWMR